MRRERGTKRRAVHRAPACRGWLGPSHRAAFLARRRLPGLAGLVRPPWPLLESICMLRTDKRHRGSLIDVCGHVSDLLLYTVTLERRACNVRAGNGLAARLHRVRPAWWRVCKATRAVSDDCKCKSTTIISIMVCLPFVPTSHVVIGAPTP